jgi:hypothetical protein
MKRFYVLVLVLVLGSMLAACSASTANITGADMGTGFDSSTNKVTGATTTFSKTEPVIHLVVSAANVPSGTTLGVVWTAVNVTDANGTATTNRQLNTVSKTLDSDGTIDFTMSIPSTGEWPTGSYKADVNLNDKLDRTVTFTVQ